MSKRSIWEMHHSRYVRHPGLPKAKWIKVELLPFSGRYSKMRGANFLSIYWWRINIVIRRPWLAGPARQLHPELWKSQP